MGRKANIHKAQYKHVKAASRQTKTKAQGTHITDSLATPQGHNALPQGAKYKHTGNQEEDRYKSTWLQGHMHCQAAHINATLNTNYMPTKLYKGTFT